METIETIKQETTGEDAGPRILIPELTPVVSSRISGVHYSDPYLWIRFVDNDRAYRYSGASPELYAAFMESDSKGSFFYANIQHKLAFERVELDGTISKTWAPPAEDAAA